MMAAATRPYWLSKGLACGNKFSVMATEGANIKAIDKPMTVMAMGVRISAPSPSPSAVPTSIESIRSGSTYMNGWCISCTTQA